MNAKQIAAITDKLVDALTLKAGLGDQKLLTLAGEAAGRPLDGDDVERIIDSVKAKAAQEPAAVTLTDLKLGLRLGPDAAALYQEGAKLAEDKSRGTNATAAARFMAKLVVEKGVSQEKARAAAEAKYVAKGDRTLAAAEVARIAKSLEEKIGPNFAAAGFPAEMVEELNGLVREMVAFANRAAEHVDERRDNA